MVIMSKGNHYASDRIAPSQRATRGGHHRPATRTGAVERVRPLLDLWNAYGECVLGFAAFGEEAKPAEIRLLGEMLAEWQNWGGSLRAGNFFAGVARAVLDGDLEVQLKARPTGRRRTGTHANRQEPRSA